MREQNGMDGTWLTNFVLVVLDHWLGFTPVPTAKPAISNQAAATANTVDPYEALIHELSQDIFHGLEKRLEFEAWADSR